MNQTPLESWLETWGTNLDWEAKSKLREAVQEMLVHSFESRVATLEKEIAELKGQFPYNPFCNCKQVDALLQKAIQELPDGDTVDKLQQIIFEYCPVCGKKFEEI